MNMELPPTTPAGEEAAELAQTYTTLRHEDGSYAVVDSAGQTIALADAALGKRIHTLLGIQKRAQRDAEHVTLDTIDDTTHVRVSPSRGGDYARARQTVFDHNCEKTVKLLAPELYAHAAYDLEYRPGTVETLSQDLEHAQLPAVVIVGEADENEKHKPALRHTFMVVGRDENTGKLVCFEKVTYGEQYQLRTLSEIVLPFEHAYAARLRYKVAAA